MRKLLVSTLAAIALAGAASAQTPPRLNANTAAIGELGLIMGLSDQKAEEIVAKRPYASTAAFDAVAGQGLTPEQRSKLYEQVFIPIDLNKAARAEIMLIPGMTARMAHEFEEYRPYASLAQFDKEIGKYVPAAEVARLRSYVVLK